MDGPGTSHVLQTWAGGFLNLNFTAKAGVRLDQLEGLGKLGISAR